MPVLEAIIKDGDAEWDEADDGCDGKWNEDESGRFAEETNCEVGVSCGEWLKVRLVEGLGGVCRHF